MSVPVDHHYLPQFYLSRWTRGGKLYRYVRPVAGRPVHQKKVSPRAIGYQPHLYAYSDGDSPEHKQRLELDFFRHVDDRAAVALTKLDAGECGSAIDKAGLIQFVLSLMHRSPVRIQHLREELSKRMSDVSDFDASDSRHATMIADHVNDLLSDLCSSQEMIEFIYGMTVYRIEARGKGTLLTCDMPLLLSQGIKRDDGFIMFPYAPNKLAIFAHNERTAWAFSSQDGTALINAVNDSLALQARHVVIASDSSGREFIEQRFAPYAPPPPGDGLHRWVVP
ncbi:MAG: DUF4238 domain-containing protein [Novosphingobium sp.]